MTDTVGNREDGVGGEARAVLVGAGEPRHMEELGRPATPARVAGRGCVGGGGGGGGWGAGRRGTWRRAAAWRRRSGWRSLGSWSRAAGTTPATSAAATPRTSAGSTGGRRPAAWRRGARR